MAEDRRPSASSVESALQNSVLPYRQFKDWPTSIFIDAVLAHLRATARPETMPELFRNKIPKGAKFFILRRITLDGKKRPEGDQAPCPMCTPNRFLNGALVWLPEMQCCAVIGHCCADQDSRAAADREYRWRAKRDHEETYLLENLLFQPARLEVLKGLMPTATEARKLYRSFRKNASKIQFQLRQSRLNHGGNLILTEIVGDKNDEDKSDYFGPAGFKGRNADIQTLEHNFGLMAGGTATLQNYDPVKELEFLIRQLGSLDDIPTEAQLVEFLTSIDERQRTAAVAIMETVDAGIAKWFAKLQDFLAFFTRENVERLNAYGTSNHNSYGFDVEYGLIKQRPTIVFKRRHFKCVLTVGELCSNAQLEWPGKKLEPLGTD